MCFSKTSFFNLLTSKKAKNAQKFIVSQFFLKRDVDAFFKASVLKEVRILCVRSTITVRSY